MHHFSISMEENEEKYFHQNRCKMKESNVHQNRCKMSCLDPYGGVTLVWEKVKLTKSNQKVTKNVICFRYEQQYKYEPDTRFPHCGLHFQLLKILKLGPFLKPQHIHPCKTVHKSRPNIRELMPRTST